MLLTDNIQRQLLQILANNSAQKSTPEAEQRSASHLQLNPGQQVKAEIISTMSNHLYLARVAGELFKLEIPLVVQPGQSVPLGVVAVKPRVVFELQRQQEGEESVSLSFLGRRLAAPEYAVSLLPEEEGAEGAAQEAALLSAIAAEVMEGEMPVPTVEDEQRSAAKLQLSPGQQVKGEVVQTLPGRAYLVSVQGELFRLELAGELKKGESVSLTFVATQPQVLFELTQGDGPPEPVRLSTLSKWLARPPQEETSPVALQRPLVDHPAEAASLLAARLKEVLTRGGLFYESHLAKWAAGSLPLQELLKEPQGKLSPLAREEEGAQGRGEWGGNGIADDRTLSLVREQLHLLNTGALSFKGEAWPGQEMALTIEDRGTGEEPGVEAALALELPRLGSLRATVRLGGQGVTLEVVAKRRESCEELRSAGGELVAASSAAGVRLARVSVGYESEGE